MTGTVIKVIDASKRAGTGKNGKPYNIMVVEVEREDGGIVQADSFSDLNAGDSVSLETSSYTGRDGKAYTSWTASLPRSQYSKPSSAESTAEVLQAIRMVYRGVKSVEQKVDQLLGIDAGLAREAAVVEESAAAAQAKRDAEQINNGWDIPITSTPPPQAPPDFLAHEPRVEPLPDEPGDLATFMEG